MCVGCEYAFTSMYSVFPRGYRISHLPELVQSGMTTDARCSPSKRNNLKICTHAVWYDTFWWTVVNQF